MKEIKNLINEFSTQNLFAVIRLFLGYFILLIIIFSIIWFLKYFSKHDPVGTTITDVFDDRGNKKPPLDIKPIIRVLAFNVLLIVIYLIMLYTV